MNTPNGVRTLFVGGPRHGRSVDGQPSAEGELYRVPAQNTKDEPTEYKAANIVLTFPHPVTGENTGETYSAFMYVIPDLYPDQPQRAQALQQAMPDALTRFYCLTNGIQTTGGVEGAKRERVPVFVAWCDECPDGTAMPEDFPDLKSRATWMSDHNRSTGHTARWENRER